MNMSQKYLMSRDLELLESGVLADATITCGDKTWKVHKNIIRRCDWFNKAFSGNFKVNSPRVPKSLPRTANELVS